MTSQAATFAGWDASLDLAYQRRGERTVLVHRAHRGPLRVQRDLYPEGPARCHNIVVHPPGGIAGGDALHVAAKLGPNAHVLLTTPGAGKWYRGHGRAASQELRFTLGEGASLEWLPQETIVFDGALAELGCRVELAPTAGYLGWEILCLGRQAAGERFASGQLGLGTELWRQDHCLYRERGLLRGDDALLSSPVGLGGAPVCATLIASSPHLAALDGGALAELRAAEAHGGRAGITRLPHVLLARWLGDSSERARHYFIALWRLLRPRLFATPATLPRIWAT